MGIAWWGGHAHAVGTVKSVGARVVGLVWRAEVAISVIVGHDGDLGDRSVEGALVKGQLCE